MKPLTDRLGTTRFLSASMVLPDRVLHPVVKPIKYLGAENLVDDVHSRHHIISTSMRNNLPCSIWSAPESSLDLSVIEQVQRPRHIGYG